MSNLPACSSESFPVARKEHKCCECRRTIEEGEKYHVFQGIWDDPATFKSCMLCYALREKIHSQLKGWEEGPSFEWLLDYASEDETLFPDIKAILERKGELIPQWLLERLDL